MLTGDQARVVLESFAIAEHPNTPFSTGHIETRPAMIERFDHYHAATLPVLVRLLEKPSAVDAFFKRSWGRGYHFGETGHKRGCPMVLRVDAGAPLTLHWMARVETHNPSGSLTIAIDNSAGGAVATLCNATSTSVAPPPEYRSDVISHHGLMAGRATLTAFGPGFVQFVLTGNVHGVRVLWSAVSLGPHVL